MGKTLIENNYVNLGGYPGGAGFAQGIGAKELLYNWTIRGNKFVMDANLALDFFCPGGSQNHEILYNLFVAPSTSHTLMVLWYPKTVYLYRNTFVGRIEHPISCPSTAGPYYYSGNVIINSDNGGVFNNTACFTDSNNLRGTSLSTYIDPTNEYKLNGTYASYVGSRGWQLSDGLTPMELVGSVPFDITHPSAPTGLTIY
jgi:hypothetical protein